MIKRMSFRNLKASFSKQARKQQLHHHHHCDFVRSSSNTSSSNNANGVMENKEQRSDSDCLGADQKHCSVAMKLRKHENKKNKDGLWKTLRKKLSRNRRKCRDRNEPYSQSDDSDQGHSFTSGNRVGNDVVVTAASQQVKSHSSETMTSPFRFQRLNSSSDVENNSSVEADEGGAMINSGVTTTDDENDDNRDTVDDKLKSPSSQHALAQVSSGKALSTRNNNNKNHFGSSNVEYGVSSPVSNNNNNNNINKFSDATSNAANYHHSLVPHQEAFNNLLDRSVSSAIPEDFFLYETPKIRSLTKELFKLSKHGWYWGPITRTEAEEKLVDQPDGAFLVRDSSDDRHLLSLSFRSFGKTLHTRIEHCNGLFSFYAQPEPEGHTSIVDLIEHSMNYSQSGIFCYSRARTPGSPSFPVRLTKPVSRFTQVRSLQYLCRFIIRQYTRFDHIQKLPLPSRIKGYIEEGHY